MPSAGCSVHARSPLQLSSSPCSYHMVVPIFRLHYVWYTLLQGPPYLHQTWGTLHLAAL